MENEHIGKYLKNLRTSKKVSLEELSKKTKININILKALEENIESKLPNKIYIRGYVQNYTKSLGGNIKEALEIFEGSENLNKINEEQEEIILPKHFEERKSFFKDKLISFLQTIATKKNALILLSLVMLIFGLKFSVNYFSKLKIEKEITKEKEEVINLPDEKPLEAPAALVEVKEITKAPNTPVSEEAQKKEEPKKQTNSSKYPFIKFSELPTENFTTIKDSKEANDPSIFPSNVKNLLQKDKANVYVKATSGDTWLSYKVDDNKITRYVLKEASFLSLRGDVIRLFLGNVNNTKIFYNNELIEPNSKTGVKSLVFPPEKGKDYLLPLFPNYQGLPMTSEEYIENMEEEPKD